MARVLILGAGVMGSAIAVPALDNGHQVTLVGTHLDGRIIEALRKDRNGHPKLNAPLPPSVQPLEIDALSEAHLRDADFVIVGVSSPGIDWATDKLKRFLTAPAPSGSGYQGSAALERANCGPSPRASRKRWPASV